MNTNSMYKYCLTLTLSTLLSACGGNQSGRFAATAEASAPKQDGTMSTVVLRPTNKLKLAADWLAEDGEKYTLLGEFAQSELGTVSLEVAKDSREIGTLSYIRSHSDFQSSYPSSTPVPINTATAEDTKLKAFIVRANDRPGVIMVAIKSLRGTAQLEDTATPIDVESDFKFRCTEIYVPPYTVPDSPVAEFTLPEFKTACDENGVCQMKYPFATTTLPMSYTDAIGKRHATCTKNEYLATQVLHLTNTSHVSSFQIKLTGELKMIASEIDFVNSL